MTIGEGQGVKLAGVRAGVIVLLASLLQSCGGGDGEGDGGNNGGPVARLNVNLTEINVAAIPG